MKMNSRIFNIVTNYVKYGAIRMKELYTWIYIELYYIYIICNKNYENKIYWLRFKM